MWVVLTPALLFSLAWILLAGVAFWQIPWLAERLIPRLAGRGAYRGWLAILGLALLVRLVPALLLPVGAGYDIESFRLAGEALLGGQDVYSSAAIGRHPYLPFQMYLIGLALFAARHSFFPFVVLVKLPAVLADVAITGIILDAARRSGWQQRDVWILGLAYALNPVSILVSAYHGQFDAIPVALLLLAWSIWFFKRRSPASAVSLGFAILSKTWPIIFLPVVWLRMANNRQRLLYGAIAGLVPLVFTAGYLVIFGADPLSALRRPLTHTGVPGYWGLSAILAVGGKSVGVLQSVYDALFEVRRWLLLVAGLLVLWRTRRQPAMDALVSLILVGLAVSVGMGLQWLLWVIPFAIIARDLRWLRWYTAVGTLFLLVQLYGYHMAPWAYEVFSPEGVDRLLRLISLPPWIVTTLWAARRLLGGPASGVEPLDGRQSATVGDSG